MNKLLKDPLLHFLLIGIAIFILFEVKSDDEQLPKNQVERNVIVFKEEQVNLVIEQFNKRFNRAPNRDEILKQLKPLIKTEVFYREGLALELDKGDDQVKQRIADKMRFLTEDIMNDQLPTTEQLQRYLDEHQFSIEAKIDFEHLFFSYSRKHTESELMTIAQDKLLLLKQGTVVKEIKTATPLNANKYKGVTKSFVIKTFGYKYFSSQIFSLPSDGSWHGPFKSKFGVHLVKVSKLTPENKTPALSDVSDEVEKAWSKQQRQLNNLAEYEKLKKTYEIQVEFPSDVDNTLSH